MLLVRTYLKECDKKGIGLFAEDFIAKNTIVWMDNLNFDRRVPKSLVDSDPLLKEYFNKYYCLIGDEWQICFDNARFMNHGVSPNITSLNHCMCIANRDIEKDEELTIDYSTICDTMKDENSLKNYI